MRRGAIGGEGREVEATILLALGQSSEAKVLPPNVERTITILISDADSKKCKNGGCYAEGYLRCNAQVHSNQGGYSVLKAVL